MTSLGSPSSGCLFDFERVTFHVDGVVGDCIVWFGTIVFDHVGAIVGGVMSMSWVVCVDLVGDSGSVS